VKLNFIQTIVTIALSLLIECGLHSFYVSKNKILLSLGSFVFLTTILVITIGVNFEQSRTRTKVRVISGIFFAIALASNLIFSFFTF
jgi:membrane-anchored protein YejM (alkaline phosphatase superfamily)